MDLKTAYSNFCRTYNDDLDYIRKIKTIINNQGFATKSVVDGATKLEDYILQLPGNRTRYINVYSAFVKWANKEGFKIVKKTPTSSIREIKLIEIIKFLQEHHRRKDIMEEFLVKERQLNDDFKRIEQGINVLGSTLKVSFEKHDRDGRLTIDDKGYHSSCNPIFLPLNMTELYLLTNIIPSVLEKNNSFLLSSYKEILEKIYPQLTDYALDLMNVDINSVSLENKPFVFEYDSIKDSLIKQLIYFIKSSRKVTIVYRDNNDNKEITGIIKPPFDTTLKMSTDDNNIVEINSESILFIKDFEKTYK